MTSAMPVAGEESHVEFTGSAAKVSEDLCILLVFLHKWSARADESAMTEGSHSVEADASEKQWETRSDGRSPIQPDMRMWN